MKLFRRRRPAVTSKESALADARRATRRLRRTNAKARRYRAGEQADPVREMTPNQWLGGNS